MRLHENPEFIRLYKEGLTSREIGERLGITESQAENWAKKARRDGLIERRKTRVLWTPERLAEAKRLWDARTPWPDMAAALGATVMAVMALAVKQRWVRGKRNNVTIPVDELRALVAQGLRDGEIGKRYNLSQSAVQRQRAVAGIRAAHARKVVTLASIEARLRELYAAGERMDDIAKELGIGSGRARSLVCKLGLKRKKARPAHLYTEEVRRKISATLRAKAGLKPRVIPMAKAVEPTPEIIPDHARPWLTRKFGECAYPYGERGNVHSCCKPTFAKTPYCEGHAALCFDYRNAA